MIHYCESRSRHVRHPSWQTGIEDVLVVEHFFRMCESNEARVTNTSCEWAVLLQNCNCLNLSVIDIETELSLWRFLAVTRIV